MRRRMTWMAMVAVGLVLALAATGCAAGSARFQEAPAGFWAGLWHGAICLVTFVIGLFSDTVRMYEPHNTGSGYDFGFLLGMLIIYGGSGASRSARRRRG